MKTNSLILLIAIISFNCNPVKQILKDRTKFDIIKDEVIRLGYCANDTTIISSSDTLIQYDTIVNKEVKVEVFNDTVYITKSENIVKKVMIRDTIKSILVDNARIKVLETDLAKINAKADDWKSKAEKRLNWLILSIIGIGLWIFFKMKP